MKRRLFVRSVAVPICLGCCIAWSSNPTTGLAQTAQETPKPTSQASASASHSALSGDPTLPSGKIKERLGAEPIAPTAATAHNDSPLPELRLKGIVMAGKDRGSALLEHAGKQYRVLLLRGAATPSVTVSIDGTTWKVEEFTNRSIQLRSGDRVLLVR